MPDQILIYANGYKHKVHRINWALTGLFILFHLQPILIEEGQGLDQNRK